MKIININENKDKQEVEYATVQLQESVFRKMNEKTKDENVQETIQVEAFKHKENTKSEEHDKF